MKRDVMMKWISGAVLLLLTIAAGFFVIAPAYFDKKLNVVVEHEPYDVSAAAKALHASIPVADLHADTLLWARNPLKYNNFGQTDLPRFRSGGMKLQLFTAVTKAPKGQNYERNSADSDQLTLLAIAQRWPVKTWNSLYERAAYQAARLHNIEAHADGDFQIIRTQADLHKAMTSNALAAILGMEGAHPLEGDLGNVDRLFDVGYRVMGLQHFFDNELGGSLHGLSGNGLTVFGEQAVDQAVSLGMIIDVAHSSEAVVRDVLSRSAKPVIVSHTGFKGACDTVRNIPDQLMQEIAATGGLIGVGFWDDAICDARPQGIARMLLYGVELVGVEHIALGSDFDGSITAYLDASELAAITQALIDQGADDATIRAVMGENAVRFFAAHLPQ